MNRILVSEYNDVPASIQDDGTISGYPLEIGEQREKKGSRKIRQLANLGHDFCNSRSRL